MPFYIFFVKSSTFTSLKFHLVNAISAPVKLLSIPFQEIKKILYYHRTFEEYKRLKREVSTLQARLIGQEEVIRENSRLEKLLEFKRESIYSSVAASVIGRNPSNWNSSMVIDKGSVDGIKEGQAVINALGVVGKIVEVSEHKSKVILLVDPQFSVAALVQRPRESGLVSGTLQGYLKLQFINKDADIQVGDKVITSKLSSSFPDGLFIGEVIQVIDDPQGASVDCLVRPAVSISQIEDVLVILK